MTAERHHARRALDLLLELMHAERGRSRAQIAQLPGYRDLSEEAFTKALYRERAYLRECGIIIDATRTSVGSEHYRLHPSSDVPESVNLNADDLELIHVAASLWKDADRLVSQPVISVKARAYTDETEHPAPRISLNLEGAEVVAACHEGIRRRYVLSFMYRSLKGSDLRSVEPWKLIVRGRALYLWGWDLDRNGARLYRLSRMVAPVDFLGEAGDAAPMPPDHDDPLSSLMVAPIFSVSSPDVLERVPFDAIPLPVPPEEFSAHTPEGEQAASSIEESARVAENERVFYRGEEDTRGVWITRFLAFPDLRPEAPEELRDDLLSRVRAAAHWGSNA